MKTSVADLSSYRNEAVVARFRETWNVPIGEAEELFDEMKKWLWLIAYCQAGGNRGSSVPLAISQATKLIDEMWHTFILFTKDYVAFCDEYFGHYVHHRPTPKSEYDRVLRRYEQNPDAVIAENRERFGKQYALIYDVLGEETLVRWYANYHQRYTDDSLRRIWRWSFSPYDKRAAENTLNENTRVG